MLLQRWTLSAKILVPVAVKSALLQSGLIFTDQGLWISQQSLWGETWMGLLGSNPQCWERWMYILPSLFPTGETLGPGGPSHGCANLGDEQWRHSAAVPLNLLVWSFLMSVTWQCFSLIPSFWDFQGVPLCMEICQLVLWGGLKSGMTYVATLMILLLTMFSPVVPGQLSC